MGRFTRFMRPQERIAQDWCIADTQNEDMYAREYRALRISQVCEVACIVASVTGLVVWAVSAFS